VSRIEDPVTTARKAGVIIKDADWTSA